MSLAMELKWCLIWDKVDHARQKVFVDHVFENMSISQARQDFIKTVASAALFEALCRDNVSFVHLLIENGVSMKDLHIEQLKPDELENFCARILTNNSIPLYEAICPNAGINKKSSEFVEAIYIDYLKQYLKDYIKLEKNPKPQQSNEVLSNKSSNEATKLFNENKIEKLYLWFLFMNRPEMAKFLCSRCQNQTVAALLAVVIYSKAAEKNTENKDKLIQTANFIVDEIDQIIRYKAWIPSENGVEWNWQLLRDVFNWGIWKVFGQVAEPFKNNATDMNVISENDAYGTFVFLYAVAFVVISNVLLLNVLIAMFNKTIGDMNVEKEYAEKYWESKVFKKGIQLSTEQALQELKTKVSRGYDQQLEEFKNVKGRFEETGSALNYRFKQLLEAQALAIPQGIIPNIPVDARWAQHGVTVAGGHGEGSATNQLYYPCGLFVDDDQTMVIADYWNHRIIQWKMDDTNGQVVAGGHGLGNRLDQLYCPTDVLTDKETDSLIICDRRNGRVVRWSRRSGTTQGEILIDNIWCYGLAMDDQRYLYISDDEKHEVRRYQIGDKNGTLVAGGNGKGASLNQLNFPTYLFVDQQQTVYVTDTGYHRVMKWNKGAKEGIVVAGGQGKGNALTQLADPQGLFVDTLGTIYVADSMNDRVMRWPKGAKQGTVIVSENGEGKEANQFKAPV
ncbi:unnamed protein product, partial [Rotaria sordida]